MNIVYVYVYVYVYPSNQAIKHEHEQQKSAIRTSTNLQATHKTQLVIN
jgi:hypothetical protein